MSLIDSFSKKSLELKEAFLLIQSFGYLLESTLFLKFQNNQNEQIQEADLEIPLSEDSSVTAFASDVNNDGILIDAVLVPKEKARKIFTQETTSFHSKSTSIVEQHGNVFKTKLNLIKPKSTRVVQLKVFHTLSFSQKKDALIAHTQLPLFTTTPIPLTIRSLLSSSPSNFPPYLCIENSLHHYSLQSQSNWFLEKSFPQIQLGTKGIKLEIPSFHSFPLIGTPPSSRSTTFFTFRDNIPSNLLSNPSKITQQKKICIVWDSSFSRNPILNNSNSKSISQDLEFLKTFLKTIPKCRIDILTFNFDSQIKSFDSNDVSSIENHLKLVSYLGGTIGSWINKIFLYDYCLMFGDGFFSIDLIVPKLCPRFFICCSAEQRNESKLKLFAKKTNGKYFFIGGSNNFDGIIQSIVSVDLPFQFLYAEFGDQISDLLPDTSKEIISSENSSFLEFSGKIRFGTKEQAVIKLHYGTKQVQHTSTVIIENGVVTDESFLVSKAWAIQKIGMIGVEYDNQEERDKELQLISTNFGLITEATSLLILSDLDQYLKYDVPPPPSLPELLKSYNLIIGMKKLELGDRVREKMDVVAISLESIQERNKEQFKGFKLNSDWNTLFVESEMAEFLEYKQRLERKRKREHEEFRAERRRNYIPRDYSAKYDFKEDQEKTEKTKAEVNISFLQKYYHKGAFFSDAKEDSEFFTDEDIGEKPIVLPKSMASRASLKYSKLYHEEQFDKDIELSSEEPAFLLGPRITNSFQRIAPNPEGSVARNDLTGTALSRERNALRLRTRESTAKYLKNLDMDSVYYDPKSRSMREDSMDIDSLDIQPDSYPYKQSENFYGLTQFQSQTQNEKSGNFANLDDYEGKHDKWNGYQPELYQKYCQVIATKKISSSTSTVPTSVSLPPQVSASPPTGYVCSRCQVPGHFIHHCPTNTNPNYNLPKIPNQTGIPKSFHLDSIEVFSSIKTNTTNSCVRFEPFSKKKFFSFNPFHKSYKIPDSILLLNPQDTTKNFNFLISSKQGWDSYLSLAIFYKSKNEEQNFLVVLSSLMEIEIDNVRLIRCFLYLVDKCENERWRTAFDYLGVYRRIYEMRKEDHNACRDLCLELMRGFGGMENKTKVVEEIAGLLLKLFDYDAIEFNGVVGVHEAIRWIKYLESMETGKDTMEWNYYLNETRRTLSINPGLDSLLKKYEEQDLRVTIQWDNLDADVELHVYEPNEQHCYSMNKITTNGGVLSFDGIKNGPLEYTIRTEAQGTYRVAVKLFWIRSPQPVVVFVRIWTKGKLIEHKTVAVILQTEKQEIEVFSCEL